MSRTTPVPSGSERITNASIKEKFFCKNIRGETKRMFTTWRWRLVHLFEGWLDQEALFAELHYMSSGHGIRNWQTTGWVGIGRRGVPLTQPAPLFTTFDRPGSPLLWCLV